MKFLALGLIASLVALPVSAQPAQPPAPSRPPASSKPKPQPQTPQSIKRITGSQCYSKLTDQAKKAMDVDCHHVVITGLGSPSLNFHFDTEREDAGISYLVSSKMQTDAQGRTYYIVAGVFTHKNGKASEVREASGLCSMDPKILKDKLVGCIAELPDGSASSSVLFK